MKGVVLFATRYCNVRFRRNTNLHDLGADSAANHSLLVEKVVETRICSDERSESQTHSKSGTDDHTV